MTWTQWRCHQRKKKDEREAFATKHEAHVVKRDMDVLKSHKKCHTRKLSDKDKKITNQRLSMRVTHMGKDDSKARVKMPEYTLQLEKEVPEYTPQPEDKTLK